MSEDEDVTAAPLSLRGRRRAVATREILDAAEVQLTRHGPAALSLRAVARSLGMTVQALYHYFPSRDALVTVLIAKAYNDLTDAVQAAVDSAADDPTVPRLVVAAEGYRRWATAHPERFQLIYGTPLRHYAAPVDGPTTQAMRRMSAIFEHELFGAFTYAQLAAAQIPALSPSFREHLEKLPVDGLGRLPPPATSLLMSAWGHMHGLVILEVFGHTVAMGDHQAEIFRMSMSNMLNDIHSRIPVTGPEAEATDPGARRHLAAD
ncbi:TetR/AcrR family transcriptional regulator [Streptomyces sp. SID3343]|uniref:TetR/AcrR family transcriptional regulator n=1 Tax=Streptomyces sp. SID3343 TaxID=2690260 RepID=UPI00136D7A98|nr:TetR/AcrR family transcriptional regulator [Streptomyces sp. SID3343]MYW05929.1 TetR family transcriptional regulator [Streptomyces sp. SID3343]